IVDAKGCSRQPDAQAARISVDRRCSISFDEEGHLARTCSMDLALAPVKLIRSEAPLTRIFSASTSLIVASLNALGIVAAPVGDSKPKCRVVYRPPTISSLSIGPHRSTGASAVRFTRRISR